MDRFDNMRVFAKVVESGSFAGAATRLGISTGTASEHVKECAGNWTPFDLVLEQIRIFPVTNVIYLELGKGADEMFRIHAAMNSRALEFEEPFAYHPHITLAQEIPPAEVANVNRRAHELWDAYTGPRSFRADRTAFVQNTLGNFWIDLAEFSLGAVAV